MNELRWSQEEKRIARRAFEGALQRELEATIQEAKRRAAKIRTPEELWELEDFLGARRREIDKTFDYRYSVLPQTFGLLIRSGRMNESELQGLREEKVELVRRWSRS